MAGELSQPTCSSATTRQTWSPSPHALFCRRSAGMAAGANDTSGRLRRAGLGCPGSPVSIRRVTITVDRCTPGHRSWVAL
jgi:hypothetical protein